ncbi:MAG TPA: aldolase/citrate lyase family protein [Holophagaceae bacterium]
MTPAAFRDRLRAGDPLFGTLVQIPRPEVAVRLARQGFDWLFLDGEHGGYGPIETSRTLAVLGGAVPCLLRVPNQDPEVISDAAACGAAGLIVPHVDSASQAEAAVGAVRGRGLVVVQAESREAVAQIGAIARVPGVDAVFVGPYDLTTSLGIPERFEHPDFLAALEAIRGACRAVGVPLGIFRGSGAEARVHLAQGFTLLAAGTDGTLLEAGARALLADLRG